MYHPTFHPIRLNQMGPPTITWLRETLSYVREQGIHGWSADGWAAFNDARRTVRIVETQSGWEVSSERDIQGATVLFPPTNKKMVVDGKSERSKEIQTAGQKHSAIVLDLKAKQPVTVALA
jgi:hypothetical protein